MNKKSKVVSYNKWGYIFLIPFVVIYLVFQMIIEFNIGFGIFNLIPLPPLDGSHVLMQLLPRDMAYKLAELERYSFLILIVLLMTPVLSMILIPCRAFIWQVFMLLLRPFI